MPWQFLERVAQEQATASDPALRIRESNSTDNSWERNIDSNVGIVRRLMTFLEDNVPIREVTFRREKYADQGKKLHIPEGAHFVWEHCFDMLSRT